MSERKIITSNVFPPIPVRSFDWQAWFDGEEEGLCGWGETQEAAIKDLQELAADTSDAAAEFGEGDMSKPKKISVKMWTKYFQYLDDLRESGITNMYGAPPYVMDVFDVDRDTAVKITSTWMKSFSLDKSPKERAAALEQVSA